MAQVSYPGVYIEEIPSGVRTITGVSTSIAAFLGRASKGKINKAVRLLSYADYERNFGVPHEKSALARSVGLFFDNGGTDCYVIRLAEGATPAMVTLENLAQDPVLIVTAKAEGIWGNTVRLEVDYNTQSPDETFNLRVIHEAGGVAVQTEAYTALSMDPDSPRYAPAFVTSSSSLVSVEEHPDVATGTTFAGSSRSRRPLGTDSEAKSTLDDLINGQGKSKFEVSVDGSAWVPVDLAPWADVNDVGTTIADIQDHIAERINDQVAAIAPAAQVTVALSAAAFRLIRIDSSGASSSQNSVRVRRASANDIASALMLGVEQGGIETARFSNFRPAPNASIVALAAAATPNVLTHIDAIAQLDADAITSISVNGVSVNLGTSLVTTGTGSDPFYQSAVGYRPETGENDGVREKLRIIVSAINGDPSLDYRAELWGYTLAIMSTSGTINEQPSAVSTGDAAFDAGVQLNTRRYSLGVGSSSDFVVDGADGFDGTQPVASTYLGSEAEQTGIHALDPVDLFNLMVLPDDEDVSDSVMATVWGPASTYCQSKRAFLIVDPPTHWTDSNGRPAVVQDTSKITELRSSLVKDHSAVFYPRLLISVAGVTRAITSSGAIAGLMARTDSTRGVWKAPAGIEAGIRGITGLNVKLTDAENGVLNKKGANCIRALPNGIVNWGARTLDGDDDFGSEWKYVPIRRLALMIEESLFRGTRWAVFEPNDEPLWANLRMNINAFMFSLFRQGAFQGGSPKDAYFVKVDKETTTQDDRNKGIVNIIVGFAPLKPAEFIVIKIQQIAGDL